MDGHPLIKLAYMLYWVRLTIIYGKGWLVETSRKLSPLILRVKGDWEMRSRALLMVSFARPW